MRRKNTAKKNYLKNPSSSRKKTQKKHSLSFKFLKTKEFRNSFGVFLLLFSILFTVASISYLFTWKHDDTIFCNGLFHAIFNETQAAQNITGKFGGWLAYVFIKKWFGISSLLLGPVMILAGLKLLEIHIQRIRYYILLLLAYMLFFSILFAALFSTGDLTILGGSFGHKSVELIKSVIGGIGLFLLCIFFAIVLTSISLPIFYNKMINKIKTLKVPKADKTKNKLIEKANTVKANEKPSTEHQPIVEQPQDTKDTQANTQQTHTFEFASSSQDEKEINKKPSEQKEDVPFELIQAPEQTLVNTEKSEEDVSITEEKNTITKTETNLDTPYDPRKDLESYIFPNTELLEEHGKGIINIDKTELEANKNKIETTLHHYGISIEKIFATVGPTVTLYEIVPSPGVRISKIKNLEDDIALSLAALGIRIIAPIPGKGTIGIEVPNKNPETVSFKSLVESQEYLNTKFDLPIALGKTIDNKPYIADLSKMPHLLMAGATGQGKSVGLNTIIASLLYKKHPAELKFVLVDPKKVELPLFSKIERHFLAKLPDSEDAIITDTSLVVKTLKALTIEMDMRYDLLKNAHVRNIKEYNDKFISRRLNPNEGHKFLPYIVLVVDEFADLIMTAGKEVEGPIARIAQLARAVGIHLVIATQRPSVNIITGVIKANFPARMAFRVSAKVDSRTILDTSGADQLIGRGDMLLSNGSRLDRLQCAFIDTPELEKITEFIGSQRGYPNAFALPEVIEEESEMKNDIDLNDRDPMFADAARVIVQSQHGSTSLLQRKLKLGYNRAGRLIDQLEAAGIVGPFEGSKAREVIIKDMESLEQLLNTLNEI
jgi:DNA segregation ATPase FtsK/SpoIIIE, S-DNA-T family